MKKRTIICYVLMLMVSSCIQHKRETVNTLDNNSVEDFKSFYSHYVNDSLFQISRIKFPLHGIKVNNENVGIDTDSSDIKMIWTKKNWVRALPFDSATFSSEYEQKFIITDSLAIREILGKGNGYSNKETFKLIHGKWYLVYMEHYSL